MKRSSTTASAIGGAPRLCTRGHRLGYGILVFLIAHCAVARATAQPSSEPGLAWDAPAECPDRSQVLARLHERLASHEHEVPAWRAVARIRKEQAGYRLELEVRVTGAPDAERRLRAATCRALADATAVLIALAMEPQPTAATEPPVGTAPAPAEPPPAKQPTAAPAAAVPAVSPTPRADAEAVDSGDESASNGKPGLPLELALGASLRLDVGTLPRRPSFGAQPQVGVRWGALDATAGFTVFLPGEARSASYPNAVVRGRALLGDLAVGVAVTEAPLRLAPAVVLEHGELVFEVRQIRDPAPIRVRWTGLGPAMHAAYVLPFGLELSGRVTGLLPFSRPRPVVHTAAADVPVFAVSAFLLRFSLGATYVFP